MEENITCKMCNFKAKSWRSLGVHVKKVHNMDAKFYYDKYLSAHTDGFCCVCGKETKFKSLKIGYVKHCGNSCGTKDKETQKKYKNTSKEKYGTEYPAQSQYIQDKMKATVISRYGVTSTFLIPEAIEKSRKTLKLIYGDKGPLGNALVREKIEQTILDKYEVDNVRKSTFFQNKMYETKKLNRPNDPTNLAKQKQTKLEKYNNENYNNREKAKNTCQEHYGVVNPLQDKNIYNKTLKTKLEKYGDKNYNNRPAANATKRKNGTFNTSKIEEDIYSKLVNLFGSQDIKRNYSEDSRYPFMCDFYIVSKDLFIEANIFVTHHGHWYNDELDKQELSRLQQKSTKFYDNIIDTWTKRDVDKRNIARRNNLNYIVFWKNNDIDLWISSNCPNGHDWDCEYSWLKEVN
jgi:hypothetical protein